VGRRRLPGVCVGQDWAIAFTHVLVEHRDDLLMVTMNNPARRNALSRQHILELTSALAEFGDSDALGVWFL
jgi:enoyl-CoA hydratase/carnithine racemase